MSETSPPATRLSWSIAACSLVALGTVLSGYLLARHFSITGTGAPLFDICQAVFGSDCDAAIRSDVAVQLGIPLAGWGLVHFAAVGVALILVFYLGDAWGTVGTLAALGLCLTAMVLGAVLTAWMVSGVTAFCPLCVVVHAINLLLIPVLVMASGRTPRELWRSLGRGCQYLAGATVVDPILVRWRVTGLVTMALAGVVTYQWVLIQADRHTAESPAPMTFEQAAAEFDAGPVYDIPPSDDDALLGDRDAHLQLVLFSDFECPACRRFARAVAHVREHHPELAVVFKHYPLGKTCNAGIRRDLHPLSCGAAYAAEAARRQGKFWEYHNALFASPDELDADVLGQLAQDAGLDRARFEADRADAATKDRVAADVALGKQLKVRGTPTGFLNKKRLSTHAMSFLDELIERESNRGNP